MPVPREICRTSLVGKTKFERTLHVALVLSNVLKMIGSKSFTELKESLGTLNLGTTTQKGIRKVITSGWNQV